MMYFYSYKVYFWDAIACEMKSEIGFTKSSSYADAVKQINEWYGEDEVESISIHIIDEGDVILTPQMIIDAYKKHKEVY